MTKFYASSANRSLVISAQDAHEAATKLIDEVMGDHIWIYGDESLSQTDRRSHLAIEAILNLDVDVSVSERGAGRNEAGSFPVADLVVHWHELMTALAIMMGPAPELESRS